MGCNLFEATKRVVEYYGEENIAEITMTPVGDGSENVCELTEEQAKQIKEQTLLKLLDSGQGAFCVFYKFLL